MVKNASNSDSDSDTAGMPLEAPVRPSKPSNPSKPAKVAKTPCKGCTATREAIKRVFKWARV